MKIDPAKHKPSWRVQRGCRVEWAVDRKSGSGVVKQVISNQIDEFGKSPSEVIIIDDDTKEEMVIALRNIRILKG